MGIVICTDKLSRCLEIKYSRGFRRRKFGI